jgi:hypothetical protein
MKVGQLSDHPFLTSRQSLHPNPKSFKMGQNELQQPTSPPYLPASAILGGIPTSDVDVPICAVLLVLYLLGLLTHARIYLRNRTNHNTKFRLSILMMYMCFLRLVTMSLTNGLGQTQ